MKEKLMTNKKILIIIGVLLLAVVIIMAVKLSGNKTDKDIIPMDYNVFAAKINSDDPELQDMNVPLAPLMAEFKVTLLGDKIDENDKELRIEIGQKKIDLVDYYIEQKLFLKSAESVAISRKTLSAEDKKEIKENTDYYIESLAADFGDGTSGKTPEEQLSALFKETGLTREIIEGWMTDTFLTNKYYEYVNADIVVEDYQITNYLLEMGELLKGEYEEDPVSFSKDYTNFYYYIPEGTRSADIVAIKLDGEIYNKISALREAGDEVGADNLLKDSLPKIEKAANDILTRLNNGEQITDIASDYSKNENIAFYRDNPTIPDNDLVGIFQMEQTGVPVLRERDQGYFIGIYNGEFAFSEEIQEEIKSDVMQQLWDSQANARYKKLLTDLSSKYTYTIDYEILGLDELMQEYEEYQRELESENSAGG